MGAEAEEAEAVLVNEEGAGHVAEAAARLGVPLVHLSTDYVFDGALDRPYREDDPTAPTGAYGRSKLAGEKAVAERWKDCVILRTAWVYSPFGANFVRTMLRLNETRDEVGVVADQRGNPTSALDIAALLLDLAPGDEVIMPSFTFVSTANAFVLRGAVPVFVDIREDTLNLDETLVEPRPTTVIQ